MTPDSKQTVSAQVVLIAASGKHPDKDSRITTANINEWLPSPEVVFRVGQAFRVLGFEVADPVGISFSISGPVHLFESVFKTHLRRLTSGAIQFSTGGQDSSYELDREKIPRDLRKYVSAITFTPPPAFGPKDY